MAKQTAVIIILCMIVGAASGVSANPANQPPDIPSDSTEAIDSLLIPDTLMVRDSLDTDTLTDAQRQLMEFEERYRRLQRERESEPKEQFSFSDTLVRYFLSPRLNQRELIGRSFFHDPGDYFKFDPGYFILDHQVTPMRKTVQPFGLSGDRLNVLLDDWPIHPFDHIPEPDGLIDLNDVPSALDYDVFVLPGPLGRLFGGKQSVATLLTRPRRPDSYEPESAFLVDKGSFAYSYARGRYSKLFTQGREIDMSIGYRKADGVYAWYGDDSYHYFGDVYLPLSRKIAFRATGQLYDREGRLAIRPYAGGTLQNRNRFDRTARLALVKYARRHTARYELGYTHLRQAVYLNPPYQASFDQTGHGVYFSREWIVGTTVFKTAVDGDYLEYRSGNLSESVTRLTGGATASVATLGSPYRYAFQASQRHVEGFRFLPSVTAVLYRESEKFFILASTGYSERAPSLHELYLPERETSIYGRSSTDYADHGNPDLQTEKQLIASLELELGRPDNSVGVSVTGGKIFDGIDWKNEREGDQTVFWPVNGDIDFVNVTSHTSIRMADFLRLHAGAAYHYLDYEGFEGKAYAPEYQSFSGLELHLFWRQKLIDLYAYSEIVYVSSYNGYEESGLGERAVVNAKLSFRMSRFRFHYVFQNVLANVYESREYFRRLGRYNYWGFTWDFLN